MYNTVKERLKNGEAILNAWLAVPSTVTAEAIAHQGFDSVTVDAQHGLSHLDAAHPLIRLITASPATPLARVPWNEPGTIMKFLDAGAHGIICPMVNSREECEAFVGACRYPPQGYRSFGPTGARLSGDSDYADTANDQILTMAMIETAAALENLDEILSVDELDAIYVGPADLSLALGGRPGADWREGPVPETLDTILAACKRHGIIPGLHTASVAYAKDMISKGFQFTTVGSDLAFMSAKAKEVVADFRESHQQEDSSKSPY